MTEAEVEQWAIDTFGELGYSYRFGPDIGPEGDSPERVSYSDVLLRDRLRNALHRLNPNLPQDAVEEAFRKIANPEAPSLILNNRAFHTTITDGVDVQFQKDDRTVTEKAWLFDLNDVDNNDWLVVNQFTVKENNNERRPDVVVFVNGMPLAVIELKNPEDEDATVRKAFNQLGTYKEQIPSLFMYNEAMVITDGFDARLGTLTAPWERFTSWRTVDGGEIAPVSMPMLEVLIKGVFDRHWLLDIVRNFNVFEEDGGTIIKKMAAYHQYHAVRAAVGETIKASAPEGNRRVGVIWHTQGSGKSLTMAFYVGRMIDQPELENPTIVVITDRNDLDDQLFRTFSLSRGLLRQDPEQADSVDDLKSLLTRAAGGIIFTTAQKFKPEPGQPYPLLSDRRNIVVLADEAHRSQYDFIDGFARHIRDGLPNASFIGFTGTPIEFEDRNTRAVFGDYISIYDVERAVEDKTTVPIYYEGRLAKVELDEEEKPSIDQEFDDITEDQEDNEKQRAASKWSRLESLIGTDKRVGLVAEDIVDHFGKRVEVLDGKAMIVCMSRRICVDLYNQLVKLRPDWHDNDHGKGRVKVVMTGSASDPEPFRPHLITKQARKLIENRFKDPEDDLQIVIVRDMWLTGFDVPCLHTMYIDKPVRGHTLMQTIARVNRVFRDKPGGLIVDYLGLADELKRAMATYTNSGGTGRPTLNVDEAVATMLTEHEILCNFFHGFDWTKYISGSTGEKLSVLRVAVDKVFGEPDGAERIVKHVTRLSRAFALSVPRLEAMKIRDDLVFFQAVKAQLVKITGEKGGEGQEAVEIAIKQLVSKAVSTDEVVDVLRLAGLEKPDISILSDEFLEEVRSMPQKSLAAMTLKKLLEDRIKGILKRNVVLARSFSEMLENTVIKYQNRTIQAAEVIAELVELAKGLRDAMERGEKLNLSDDEVAFYDALGANDAAVLELGDDTLKAIARELVEKVRNSVTIDWTLRESARARLRVLVKTILKRYGYPPDKQQVATDTVLSQAEVLCKEWAA